MTKTLADEIRKFADSCEDERIVAAVFLKSGDLPSQELACAKRDGSKEGDMATERLLTASLARATSTPLTSREVLLGYAQQVAATPGVTASYGGLHIPAK